MSFASCYENVFYPMNTWITRKDSMKHRFLEKKQIPQQLKNGEQHRYRRQALRKNLERLFETIFRSSRPEVFSLKGVLKICSKFTGDHPSQSVVSIKLLCNFIEITLWHGYSPVNLLHFFGALFSKNTSGWLLLVIQVTITLGVILLLADLFETLRVNVQKYLTL